MFQEDIGLKYFTFVVRKHRHTTHITTQQRAVFILYTICRIGMIYYEKAHTKLRKNRTKIGWVDHLIWRHLYIYSYWGDDFCHIYIYLHIVIIYTLLLSHIPVYMTKIISQIRTLESLEDRRNPLQIKYSYIKIL